MEGDGDRLREKREGFLAGAVCTGGGEGEWRDPKIGILAKVSSEGFWVRSER